jgi:hypothetical protein
MILDIWLAARFDARMKKLRSIKAMEEARAEREWGGLYKRFGRLRRDIVLRVAKALGVPVYVSPAYMQKQARNGAINAVDWGIRG